MWKDEIVEETRKVREEYAEKFNYDLEAIYKDLKEQEKSSNQKIVSMQPKEPELIPQAKPYGTIKLGQKIIAKDL